MLSVTVPKDVRLVSDRIKDLYGTSKYCFINTIVAYFMFNMPSVSETQRSFAFAVYGAQFTRELGRRNQPALSPNDRAIFGTSKSNYLKDRKSY